MTKDHLIQWATAIKGTLNSALEQIDAIIAHVEASDMPSEESENPFATEGGVTDELPVMELLRPLKAKIQWSRNVDKEVWQRLYDEWGIMRLDLAVEALRAKLRKSPPKTMTGPRYLPTVEELEVYLIGEAEAKTDCGKDIRVMVEALATKYLEWTSDKLDIPVWEIRETLNSKYSGDIQELYEQAEMADG